MASLPAPSPHASVLAGSPVCFRSRYSINQYIAQENMQHGFERFVVLSNYLAGLTTVQSQYVQDTAAGAVIRAENIENGGFMGVS